jgi:hypothetical protein
VVELTNVGRGRLRPYDDHMSEAYADLADATIFVNQGRLVRLQPPEKTCGLRKRKKASAIYMANVKKAWKRTYQARRRLVPS